jgi:hypothetical protein
VESAKARFGGLGRNLRDRLDKIDAKVADSKALAEAKSRLSGGAANFKRCALCCACLAQAGRSTRRAAGDAALGGGFG